MSQSDIRQFDTGATRDTDTSKPDYDGFLCPAVIKRFGEYMHAHRVQSDGKLRDSDNWQKGIPRSQYFKSLLRHVMDLWLYQRGHPDKPTESLEDSLCAIIFNAQGYLHEHLKEQEETPPAQVGIQRLGDTLREIIYQGVPIIYDPQLAAFLPSDACGELEFSEELELPLSSDPHEQQQGHAWYNKLRSLGCKPMVAATIVGGTTFSSFAGGQGPEHVVYLSGPMRGIKNHNMAEFDNVRDKWLGNGFSVISPVDIDRTSGFDLSKPSFRPPHESSPSPGGDATQHCFAYRDVLTLLALNPATDGVVMLAGWQDSIGASAEFSLARWLGLSIFDAYTNRVLDGHAFRL